MELARIESAISTCESHIHGLSGDLESIEIESGLVAFLVVTIVAEYEELIQQLFCLRAEMCGDRHVTNYVTSQMVDRFRTPYLGKINETLGSFGKDYRDNFEQATLNTPTHASWDNIVRARHAVVHKEGTLNITFRELKGAYAETKVVVKALIAALDLIHRLPPEWLQELQRAGIDPQEADPRPIGTVIHFFRGPSVAVVALEVGELNVGDQIGFRGHTTAFIQTITSMEQDHRRVDRIRSGEEVGILVSDRVRPG